MESVLMVDYTECPRGGFHRWREDGVCIRCNKKTARGEAIAHLRIVQRAKSKKKKGKPREWKLTCIQDLYIRDGRSCFYCGRELMTLDDVERCNIQNGSYIGRASQKPVPVSVDICPTCSGTGQNETFAPCADCRGAGSLSIERYAELLDIARRSNRTLSRNYREARSELKRLRELVESAMESDSTAWRRQSKLVKTVESQRETISQMAARINELRDQQED
jgi:hypothetical protein